MRYYEDIPRDYRCIVGTFVLSEAAIIDFASAWDPQPFHTDPEAARASVFGGLVASSAHLFAICTRLFFDHADPIRVVAMLGKDKTATTESGPRWGRRSPMRRAALTSATPAVVPTSASSPWRTR